jgi:DNA-binding PadR family transcriptional regulator
MSRGYDPGEDAKPLADERKRVLEELGNEPLSGLAVFRRMRGRSAGGEAEVRDGAGPGEQRLLYPALHSLEAGWTLSAEWVTDAGGTRRRTYRRRRFLPIPPSRTLRG